MTARPSPFLRSLRGHKYDALAACVQRGDTFTAAEVGVHPRRLKALMDMGLLVITQKGSTYPVRSNRYRVAEGVAERFAEMEYAGEVITFK